jgi:hypothetical protein
MDTDGAEETSGEARVNLGLTGDGRSGFDQSDPRAKLDPEKDSAELSLGAVGEGLKQKRDKREERGGKEGEKSTTQGGRKHQINSLAHK